MNAVELTTTVGVIAIFGQIYATLFMVGALPAVWLLKGDRGFCRIFSVLTTAIASLAALLLLANFPVDNLITLAAFVVFMIAYSTAGIVFACYDDPKMARGFIVGWSLGVAGYVLLRAVLDVSPMFGTAASFVAHYPVIGYLGTAWGAWILLGFFLNPTRFKLSVSILKNRPFNESSELERILYKMQTGFDWFRD